MKRTETEKDGSLSKAGERCELARQRLLGLAGSGGLGDEEAQETAERAVRQARSEAPERDVESPTPPPEEVHGRLKEGKTC